MKNLKRACSVILALLLLVSITIPVYAQRASTSNFKPVKEYTGQFSDVQTSDWFYDSVKTVYEYGLMKGVDSSHFYPNAEISIAESVALIARIHKTLHTGDGSFKQGTPWYKVYFDYMQDIGLGLELDNPQYLVPFRSWFTVLLYSSVEDIDIELINDIEIGAIPDICNPLDCANSSEYWESAPAYYFYSAGILTGGKDGAFRPDDTITRAEVATIITRLVCPEQRVEFSLSAKKQSQNNTSTSQPSTSSSAITPPSTDTSTSVNYIANTNTFKFHYTWCPYVRRMNESNKWYYTGTRDDLIAKGYDPCGHCHP